MQRMDAHYQSLCDSLKNAGFHISTVTEIHESQLIQPGANKQLAIDAFKQYLKQKPNDVSVNEKLAYLLQTVGDFTSSRFYRKQAITAKVNQLNIPDSERDEVLHYMLAKEGLAPDPAQCPEQFIIDKFDHYADFFDHHLLDILQYRGPQNLLKSLSMLIDIDNAHLDILDLGCGTGISGEVFKPIASTLWGVDFSENMLEKAQQKNIYDKLIQESIHNALIDIQFKFDCVVASDVFTYFGELDEVFTAIKNVLKPQAWFVFSVENSHSAENKLCPSGRYAHSKQYITKLAHNNAFSIERCDIVKLRKESGQFVEGASYVLRYNPAA